MRSRISLPPLCPLQIKSRLKTGFDTPSRPVFFCYRGFRVEILPFRVIRLKLPLSNLYNKIDLKCEGGRKMKKLISLIMCAAMLINCFGACGSVDKVDNGPETRGASKKNSKDDETITITIACDDAVIDKRDLRDMYRLLHKEYNVEIEYESLPNDFNSGYAEYKSAATRIRTEVMAGNGPDIFILPTWEVGQYWDDAGNKLEHKEPLFPDVEDAMRNRTFLPLDDYIAKSKIFNMEDHREIIMEAGKVNGQQMVLPLLFKFKIELLDGAQMQNPDFTYIDFESYVNSAEDSVHATMGYGSTWFNYVLSDYVDYENEKLNITKEELIHNLELSWKALEHNNENWISYANEDFDFSSLDDYFFYAWNNSEGQAVPVYIPNDKGGITANVAVYAAINANTEHPEEAFKVLELLFSENIQSESGIYSEEKALNMYKGWRPDNMFGTSGWGTLVTHKNAYSGPVMYNAEDIDELISKINCVRFTSEFDCILCDTVDSFAYIYYGPDRDKGPDFDAIAEALIKDMEMRLAE